MNACYLLQAGALHGSDEAMLCAKHSYRKLYKRNWKQRKRPRKELRIEVTLKQFEAIKLKAKAHDLKHTTYARKVILFAVEINSPALFSEELNLILQLVSMATIGCLKGTMSLPDVADLLTKAESLLLKYVRQIP